MNSNHNLSRLIILGLVTTLVFACQNVTPAEVIEPTLPRSYVAHFAKSPPNINGVIDSLEWDSIEWSEDFVDIQSDIKPRFNSKYKMSWDEDNLYILAHLQEEHVWANLKNRDTVIFYNNDFEVFIDHNGDTHNYVELEINALNTVWDLFIDKPYLNGANVNNGWDIKGFKSAVGIGGSLNNYSDKDEYWNIEMSIPWKSLTIMDFDGFAPEEQVWRINFSRVQWQHDTSLGHYARKKDDSGSFLREDNWVWSRQVDVNMHKPEYWGLVFFTKDYTIRQFDPSKDLILINWMYRIFRSSKRLKTPFKSIERIGQLEQDTIRLRDTLIENKTFIGFKSPFSENHYLINQDGKLEIH